MWPGGGFVVSPHKLTLDWSAEHTSWKSSIWNMRVCCNAMWMSDGWGRWTTVRHLALKNHWRNTFWFLLAVISSNSSVCGGRMPGLCGNHSNQIQVCKHSACVEGTDLFSWMWKFALRVSKTCKQWRLSNKNIRQTSDRGTTFVFFYFMTAFTNFYVRLVQGGGGGGGANEHKCFLTLVRAKRLRDERGKGQQVGSHSRQANVGALKKLLARPIFL